jgi:two-component system cell cycle sensor histidine kinase/response regulator CckA
MKALRDWPIKRKLLLIVMATTAAALVLSGIGIAVVDGIFFRRTMERDLTALSQIVADSSTAALAFGDRDAANETLAALRARSHLLRACIFNADGALFTKYVRPGAAADCVPGRPGEGILFHSDEAVVWRPIRLQGAEIGRVSLIFDLGAQTERRTMYGLTVSGILVVAWVVAFFLSSRLRELIARPVEHLAGTAGAVDKTGDYGLRAKKLSGDELGLLVDAFNGMLAGIQSREADLQAALRAREQALRDAETARHSLRTILVSIADAVISTNSEGRIVFANPIAQSLLGRSEREIVGRPVEEVLRIDEEAEGPLLVTPDGARIPIDERSAPLRSEGHTVGTVLIFRDVAERRRADRDSAYLAALVESSSDAVIGTTADGVVQSWNRGAEQLYGYSPAEMIGGHIGLIIPEDRLGEEQSLAARLKDDDRVASVETRRKRKDGSEVDVSLSLSLIRDRNGRVAGVSRVARDITEQKLQSERMRQTQKLESIGILAGGIAHDFNNLLAGILGNATLALEAPGDLEDVRQRLLNVVSASEKAAELTRQMLAYSGKGQFVIDRIDLSGRVRETLPLIQSTIRPAVELRLDLDDRLPAVEADPAQIQQIVMNIIINAAEAIPDGQTGRVTVSTRQVAVDERTIREAGSGSGELRPGPYVVFEVADTGSGMDAATLARIFDPFYTTKFTGRGLGLAAVLGIVRAHKGFIGVSSAPGRGSTFRVWLPAAAAPARPTPAMPAPQPPQVALGGKVLVVDDEEVVRRMARQVLEHNGCKVVLAEDGAEGVSLFCKDAGSIACVVLDLTMPVMGGEEVLKRIRSIRPDVPVILSSGYNQAEAMRRFGGRGVSGFLQKPYRSATLMEAVRAAVMGASAS